MNKGVIIFAATMLFVGAIRPEERLSWWVEAIKKIPEESFLPNLGDSISVILPASDVIRKAHAAIAVFNNKLINSSNWIDGQRADSLTTDLETMGYERYFARFSEQANATFVQTLIVPPQREIFVLGDLHGSIKSLVRTLQRLKLSGYLDDELNIIKHNFYMFFLGDFTDRGAYATEIMYLLHSLFIKNHDRVVILRGNHEDISIQKNEMIRNQTGFGTEIQKKYTEQDDRDALSNALALWYSRLPVALFLGSGTSTKTNFIEFTHGGIEPGFDPRPLLNALNHQPGLHYQAITCADNLNRMINTRENPNLDSSEAVPCGFTWGDFANIERGTGTDENRSYFFSTPDAVQWMDKYSDDANNNLWRAIVRGHQHNPQPLARGASNFAGCNVHTSEGMWSCTEKNLDVSGATAYPLAHYPIYTLLSVTALKELLPAFDSFVIIKTAEQFDDWTIRLAEFSADDTPKKLTEPGI